MDKKLAAPTGIKNGHNPVFRPTSTKFCELFLEFQRLRHEYFKLETAGYSKFAAAELKLMELVLEVQELEKAVLSKRLLPHNIGVGKGSVVSTIQQKIRWLKNHRKLWESQPWNNKLYIQLAEKMKRSGLWSPATVVTDMRLCNLLDIASREP